MKSPVKVYLDAYQAVKEFTMGVSVLVQVHRVCAFSSQLKNWKPCVKGTSSNKPVKFTARHLFFETDLLKPTYESSENLSGNPRSAGRKMRYKHRVIISISYSVSLTVNRPIHRKP